MHYTQKIVKAAVLFTLMGASYIQAEGPGGRENCVRNLYKALSEKDSEKYGKIMDQCVKERNSKKAREHRQDVLDLVINHAIKEKDAATAADATGEWYKVKMQELREGRTMLFVGSLSAGALAGFVGGIFLVLTDRK